MFYILVLSVVTVNIVFVKGSFGCILVCSESYCRYTCWMLLNNQIFELESHKVEWVEVIMGVAVSC